MSDGDGKKKLVPVGPKAWDAFLKSISEGVPLQEACLKHMVTTREIDAITRSSLEQDARWQQARLAAERCSWPQLDLDEILDRIGAGTPVIDAVSAVRGRDDSAAFFRLVEGTDLKERYLAAQRQWALREANKLVEIADDDTNDTLPGPKGGQIPNMAAVQRARLQIETRKDLMSDWAPRLFGRQKEQVNVQVNVNLAERLERGIQNLRDRQVTIRRNEEAVDAAYEAVDTPRPEPKPVVVEKPPEPKPVADASYDTTWMDADGPTDVTAKPAAAEKDAPAEPSEPLDSMWLEEK